MSAAIIAEPLIIEQGASLARIFSLDDEGGVAIDLTGCSATAHIRHGSPEEPNAIASNASTPATRLAIHTAAANGKLRWSMTAAETTALAAGDYFQELWVTFADGSVERVLVRYVQVVDTGGVS